MHKSIHTKIELFETPYDVVVEQNVKDSILFELFYKGRILSSKTLFGVIMSLCYSNTNKLHRQYWDDIYWEFKEAKEIYDAQISFHVS